MKNTVFDNNVLLPLQASGNAEHGDAVTDHAAAVIKVVPHDIVSQHDDVAEGWAGSGSVHTAVRLQGCTFSNILPATVPPLLVDRRGFSPDSFPPVRGDFYSDDPTVTVCTYEGAERNFNAPVPPPACVTSSPLLLDDARVRVEETNFTTRFLDTTIEYPIQPMEVLWGAMELAVRC